MGVLFNRRTAPHHDLTKAIDDYVERLTGDRRTLHASNHRSDDVGRCDFQVPPAVPRGWYGILTETGSKNWPSGNGAYWTEYPRRAYARSMKAFGTLETALGWARSQPDQTLP